MGRVRRFKFWGLGVNPIIREGAKGVVPLLKKGGEKQRFTEGQKNFETTSFKSKVNKVAVGGESINGIFKNGARKPGQRAGGKSNTPARGQLRRRKCVPASTKKIQSSKE